MPEFEKYLARIRAALDVSPRRADEICAEVRTHLEERARQLVESGMGREEAVTGATRAFGDPREVAQRLRKANARHRRLSAPRLLFAFAVASVGMLSSFTLTVAKPAAPWFEPLARWAREQGALAEGVALVVVTVILMAPTAVLAGMVAGPRRGWIAGLPALLWGAFLIVVLAAYEGPRSELFVGALVAVVAAPATGLMGLAGSGPLGRGRAWRGVAAGCAAYLLVLGLTALSSSGGGEILILAAFYGITLSLGVLGSAALWQGGRAWHRMALASSVACAAFLVALVRVVQLSGRVQWFDLGALTVAAVSLGLLAALGLCLSTPSRRTAVLLSASCVALIGLVIGLLQVSSHVQWFARTEPVWAWRGLVAAEVAAALALGAVVLARQRTLGRAAPAS